MHKLEGRAWGIRLSEPADSNGNQQRDDTLEACRPVIAQLRALKAALHDFVEQEQTSLSSLIRSQRARFMTSGCPQLTGSGALGHELLNAFAGLLDGLEMLSSRIDALPAEIAHQERQRIMQLLSSWEDGM